MAKKKTANGSSSKGKERPPPVEKLIKPAIGIGLALLAYQFIKGIRSEVCVFTPAMLLYFLFFVFFPTTLFEKTKKKRRTKNKIKKSSHKTTISYFLSFFFFNTIFFVVARSLASMSTMN